MTKSDLILALSRKGNLTGKQATDIVNLVFDGFAEELKKKGRIEIRGFGSFSVREYEAYIGRNPKTGSNVEIKPKTLPFFTVGKELKDRINSK